MEKIFYGGSKWKGEYEILTYEEARQLGHVPVSWREALEGGWVLSDDGFAVWCLEVKRYVEKPVPGYGKRARVRHLVLTVIGRFWNVRGQEMLWERIRARRVKKAYAPVGWIDRETAKTRTRRVVKLYAMMLLAGRVDWHVLSVLWKPTEIVPGWRVKKLFRQEEVIEMVTKEMYALMMAKGVTPEYVIEKMVRAIDLAEIKGDGNTILKACHDFRDMLGMERRIAGGREIPGGTLEGRDAAFEDVVEQAERELSGQKSQVERAQLPGHHGE